MTNSSGLSLTSRLSSIFASRITVSVLLVVFANNVCAADKHSTTDARGAAVFAETCAACHSGATYGPDLAGLTNMSAEDIYRELWYGVMAQFVNGMEDADRWAVSRWIAGQKPDKDTRDSGVPLCATSGKLKPDPAHDWPGLSNNNRFNRHVDNGLSAERVSGIKLKWAIALPSTRAFAGGGHPIAVVGDRLFFGNLNHWAYSVDAEKGCAHWTFRAEWRIRSNVAVSDGVAVFGDLGTNVYALNAETGALLWRIKAELIPSSRITGNLTVHDGVVYVPISSMQEVLNLIKDREYPCCTFRGSVIAYDLHTGKQLWKTYTIDEEPKFLGKTEKGTNRYGPSGAPVFSAVTVDAKRGLLYVPTGNQNTEPRVDESDAVIAFDMKTGAKRWVAALAPEALGGADIYHLGCESWVDPDRPTCSPENEEGTGDRDFVAPAALVTGPSGKEVIMVGSKDGMFYGLNPDDGKVLWQNRVGRGGELGGLLWGFSTDGKNAYVPIIDASIQFTDGGMDWSADGSLTAVNVETGKSVWKVSGMPGDCEGKPTPPCTNAFTLPTTAAGEIVFAGTLDGVLRAFDVASGKQVWTYDTVREYDGVNGRKGQGGTLAAFGGPVIAGNSLYLMSGMDQFNIGLRGNVLLAFDIPE